MNTEPNHSIMLYCDQELTNSLLKGFLENHGFRIIFNSNNIWEIVNRAHHELPECILIEGRRSTKNGTKELSIVKAEHPNINVIILSASDDKYDIMMAFELGASGYLLKNTLSDDFIKDLALVCKNNTCVSRQLVGIVMDAVKDRGYFAPSDLPPNSKRLTSREYEILSLIVEGKSNRDIAAQISLSVNTVNNHVSNMYRKLGTKNRASIVSLYEREYRNRRMPDLGKTNEDTV